MSSEMPQEIWGLIRSVVESGEETRKIDLKEALDISNPLGKTKLIRHICAIANTKGGTGYLIIGVIDKKNRAGSEPADFLKNWCVSKDDFERQLGQILDEYISPSPEFDYYQLTPYEKQGVKASIGVIEIKDSLRRPHIIQKILIYKDPKNGKVTKPLRKGLIFIRQNTRSVLASRDDIVEMTTEDIRRAHEQYIESLRADYDEAIKGLEDGMERLEKTDAELRSKLKQVRKHRDQLSLELNDWKEFCSDIIQRSRSVLSDEQLLTLAEFTEKDGFLKELLSLR